MENLHIKKRSSWIFWCNGTKVTKKFKSSKDDQDYEKGDYKYYMAKEIDEQPITLKNCVNEYIDKHNKEINIYNFPWKISEISSVLLIDAEQHILMPCC